MNATLQREARVRPGKSAGRRHGLHGSKYCESCKEAGLTPKCMCMIEPPTTPTMQHHWKQPCYRQFSKQPTLAPSPLPAPCNTHLPCAFSSAIVPLTDRVCAVLAAMAATRTAPAGQEAFRPRREDCCC